MGNCFPLATKGRVRMPQRLMSTRLHSEPRACEQETHTEADGVGGRASSKGFAARVLISPYCQTPEHGQGQGFRH